MNRIEAFSYLKEFPMKRLRVTRDYVGNDTYSNWFIEVKDNVIVYSDTRESVNFFIDDKSEFEIVRELKIMSFSEAYCYIENYSTKDTIMKSDITGETFTRAKGALSKREINGNWTVDEVYEDDN